MFNRIGFILVLASLLSCSRSTDIISAPEKKVQRVSIQGLTVSGDDFESDIRAVTLLAYPNAQDLKNFSYDLAPKYANLLGAKFNNYRAEGFPESFLLSERASKQKLGISSALTPNEKYATIVNQIISIGFLRDSAFKQQLITEEVQLEIYSDIETLFEDLFFFPVIDEDGTYKLVADETTEEEGESFYDCEEYTDSVETLVVDNSTSSTKTSIENQCQSFDKASSQVEFLINQVYGLGEGYVLQLLDAVQKDIGRNFLTTTMAIDRDTDEYSQLTLSEDGNTVEELTLFVDINDKNGYNEYSLENGKIKNLKFYKGESGAKVLEFEMVTDLYTVKTKLGMSVMDYYDLRFVGDATFHYKDGQVREGVMKIEVNRASDDDWDF